MKFGLRIIGYVADTRETVRLAQLAEEAGFNSIWFPHDTFMYNTWVLTSATAQATSKIHIGSVGTNPYTTDPSEIATYLGTLDDLSHGRAILGLGLHTEKMVEWTGLDASNYMTRTREAVEIIRALFRGEAVDYKGEEFQWTDQCYLRFTPFRSDPPVYVSAFGPEYLELSGRIGDGSLPMLTPPEGASYMVTSIERGIEAAGRDRSNFVISGCAWLSLSDTAQAAADVMRNMVAYFGPYLEEPALAPIGLTTADMQPLKKLIDAGDYEGAKKAVTGDMLALGITGTPSDVRSQIENLREAGIDEINLGGPLGPDPEQAIRLMGEQVIPHFR